MITENLQEGNQKRNKSSFLQTIAIGQMETALLISPHLTLAFTRKSCMNY